MAHHYQSGIVNRPAEHNMLVALNFTGTSAVDPLQARAAIVALQELVRKELHSDLDDQNAETPKDQPSPETGELGFIDDFNRGHLTVTFGISSSGFDRLGVDTTQRPADLVAIPWDLLQDTPTVTSDQGDCILQICSDDIFVCEHVIRRVEEELGAFFEVRWTMLGSQRYTTREGRTSRKEGRALIGFVDGTSNLDPGHDDEDAVLTFVDPSKVGEYPGIPQPQNNAYTVSAIFPPDLRTPPTSEPSWTTDGTYMVVRASVQTTASWDALSLGVQEEIIGRFKFSGAFRDLSDDPARIDDLPAFATDVTNEAVGVASHVRKANPRQPDDAMRRIFRRGYPIVLPSAAGGPLNRGLLFICFGRTLSTQFEFIMRAWMKNADFPRPGAGKDRLFEIDTMVLLGGYYFVPPVENRNKPWTWVLPPTSP